MLARPRAWRDPARLYCPAMFALRWLPGATGVALLLVPALAGSAPGRPGRAALGRLTLEAGDLDRRNTPVSLPLAGQPPDQALEIGAAGAWYPITRDPDGQGHFLL